MNTQIPTFEQVFEPCVAYNKIAAETAEKTLKVQMDAMKAYSKLGMDNFTDGLKVTDFDQMTAYMEKQKEVAREVSNMFISDAKAFADLSAKFFDDTKSIFEDSVKTIISTAKETTKTATAAAK